MTVRRVFIAGFAGAFALPSLMAQLPRPAGKIGYVHPRTIAPDHPTLAVLRSGWQKLGYIEGETVLLRSAQDDVRRVPMLLRELGYTDGKNVRLEFRFAEQAVDRLPALAIDARRAIDVPQAFEIIAASSADAIFLFDDSSLAGTPDARARIIGAAARSRLPLVQSQGTVAADGGLLSLGTDIGALGRRAAYYAHRILGGAKSGDLPIKRPTVFNLSGNLRTARALGLTIPRSMLLRADEVIQ